MNSSKITFPQKIKERNKMTSYKSKRTPGYSCIPENRIISSFKRFLDEKKKNSFPSTYDPAIIDIPLEDSSTSITYQSQIISCYYSLTPEEQNNFWNYLSSDEIKKNLQYLNDKDFYYAVLKYMTRFFGIERNSPNLQEFLMKKILYAYNDCGDRIYVDSILRFDDEQHVCMGVLTRDSPTMCRESDDEWVIKWNVQEDVGEELTESEMEKWRMIENNGAQIPRIVSGFMILDFQVIVMEKLYPLEPKDYNQKLIVSIVSYIEKIISIGVNNNIKPSNILKRIDKNNVTYLIADVTMMTTTEKDYGYQRFSWSPSWASQVVDLDTITTVKNDLLEFGYVLVWLSYGDEILNEDRSDEIVMNVRIVPRNKEVSDWIERVKTMNEQDIKLNDFIELKKLAMLFPKVSENYDLC